MQPSGNIPYYRPQGANSHKTCTLLTVHILFGIQTPHCSPVWCFFLVYIQYVPGQIFRFNWCLAQINYPAFFEPPGDAGTFCES